jgi:WD40 repeat protein
VPGLIAALSFTPDGQSILVVGNSKGPGGWVRIFRLKNEPRLVTEMKSGLDFYTWGTLSPDGQTVAATGTFGRPDLYCCGAVAVWDAATGRLRGKPVKIQGGAPLHAAFAPQGESLAIAGGNGLVAVIDSERPHLARRWNTDAEIALAVSFSPDGGELATADFNGFVKFWDMSTAGKAVPPQPRPPIHATELNTDSVAWSPDGKVIAASGGGELHLYDLSSGRQIGSSISLTEEPPVGASPYVAFTPDGRNIVASDYTGRTWVVPVSLDQWRVRACSVANRNLTRTEWNQFATGRSFERVCD